MTDDAWLAPMVRKRPEIGLLLYQLLIVLRSKGKCTAEDAHNIEVSHPNSRGAAMKLLKKCGAVMNPAPLRGTTKRSHGHWIFEWELKDDSIALSIVQQLNKALTSIGQPQKPQQELF